MDKKEKNKLINLLSKQKRRNGIDGLSSANLGLDQAITIISNFADDEEPLTIAVTEETES